MPHRRLAQAIARMKAKGPPALDALEESTEDLLQDLTLAEPPSDKAREENVVEEEQYVKAMLARSLNIFKRLKDEGSGYREGWTLLEKELVLEMEYTNWAVLSDRTISALAAYLLDLLVFVEKTFVVDGEGGTEALTEGGAERGAAAATQGDGTGQGRPTVPDKCRDGAPPEALDCAFATLDVVEKMMEARFLKCMGDELERPFDPVGSLHLYQSLVTALRLLVAVMQFEGYEPAPPVEKEKVKAKEGEEKVKVKEGEEKVKAKEGEDKRNGNRRPPPVPGSHGLALSRSESLSSSSLGLHGTHPSLSSPRNALAPKTFTFDDAAGESQVHTKSKANEPLQYLVTVLYLLSHTSVQTDVTAFWEAPDTIVEEQWSSRNFQALLACIGIVLDKLHHSPDTEDQALLTILVDRWVHTLHGLVCTDSIGRQMSATVPEEDLARDYENDKPGIECLTGVSTYLGRWMDVRCLPCSCVFCGVQRASMECMLSKWDRRLAHRLIELQGVAVLGRLAFWLLESFRSIEVSGDSTGENLYRTDVALVTQVVHLAVLSDYQVATLAEVPTLRARAVKQAIDSGFLNFLLAYFIPRKLCRLEDRRCETTEDQNKARRLARISCKNCIEFLLLSGDGWITDTCYNARGKVKIEKWINKRMAPAAQRLVELWVEDRRVCRTVEELLEHYAPFFLKLSEIIRLSARYGCMKEHWSQDLLDACVNVLSTYTYLSVSHYSSPQPSPTPSSPTPPPSPSPCPSLPPKKALLCAMATFTDMCSPFFGGCDHYSSASRAVHGCQVLKRLLEVAKSAHAVTSCIRALSYISRVELVVRVSSTKPCAQRQAGDQSGGVPLHPPLHATAPAPVMVCHQCHRPPTLDRPLRQCSRCKRVFYCCVECQRANWREHEKACVPPAEPGSEGGASKSGTTGGGGIGMGHMVNGVRSDGLVSNGGGAGAGTGGLHPENGNGGSSATTGSGVGSRGGGGGVATRVGGGSRAGAGAVAACCAHCAAKADSDRQLMTCGRCREAFYCSKDCQTRHWVVHRRQCGPDPLLVGVEKGEGQGRGKTEEGEEGEEGRR